MIIQTNTVELNQTLAEIADVFRTLETALIVAIQALCDLVSEIIAMLGEECGQYTEEVLRTGCSNPREWHFYKHTKRFRTRKKYMNRFINRILEE